MSAFTISDWDLGLLERRGWSTYVGTGLGIWVGIPQQALRLIRGRELLRCFACSTAAAGAGNRLDSLRTPTGWHEVCRTAGAGLLLGAALKGCEWTGEVWRPTDRVEDDLILTRALVLEGLQPGVNRGGDIDSRRRGIFIHGTNAPHLLGTPASHGCIRLSNRDVAELFDLVDVSCRVLITQGDE